MMNAKIQITLLSILIFTVIAILLFLPLILTQALQNNLYYLLYLLTLPFLFGIYSYMMKSIYTANNK